MDESCERTCGENGDALCTLANQLVELDSLDAETAAEEWRHAEPQRRVNVITSTHGSMSYKDARVPLGFSYPGATSDLPGEDDVMQKAIEVLEAAAPKDERVRGAPEGKMQVERSAMEAALGIDP